MAASLNRPMSYCGDETRNKPKLSFVADDGKEERGSHCELRVNTVHPVDDVTVTKTTISAILTGASRQCLDKKSSNKSNLSTWI